jgi:hypothetical protein
MGAEPAAELDLSCLPTAISELCLHDVSPLWLDPAAA